MTLRISFFTLLLALVALPLAGCDSSDDDDDNVGAACPAANEASGTFTATAGGGSFDAVCIQVIRANGTFTITGLENLGQTGTSAQGTLSISVASAGTGRFSAPFAAIVTYSENAAGSTTPSVYAGLSGSVDIAELSDSRARGTFSFTVRDNSQNELQITGGSFDVTF